MRIHEVALFFHRDIHYSGVVVRQTGLIKPCNTTFVGFYILLKSALPNLNSKYKSGNPVALFPILPFSGAGRLRRLELCSQY